MKLRKNLLTAALVGLMAIGVGACGGDAEEETPVDGGGATEMTPTEAVVPTEPVAPATG